MEIDEDEAKRIVGVYRDKNDRVIELWGDADRMLLTMMNSTIKTPLPFGEHGCVWFDNDGIRLPNNLLIRYPKLRREDHEGKTKTIGNQGFIFRNGRWEYQ